jgi:RNA polymerase sigma factor (sigma-70 family)
MNEPAIAGTAGDPSVGQQHPLLADRARLDRIVSNMDITIQRTLYGRRLGDGEERLLHGGISATDVLQKALLEVLRYDPAKLKTSWEALSVTIARCRAIDAVRDSTRGRRPADADADEPDEITIVSLDELIDDRTGADTSAWSDPEQAFIHNEQQKVLRRLIRELPEPSRTIVDALHYQGRSRVEVGKQVDLTPQRVGQIYAKTLPTLLRKAQEDPEFPADMTGGEMTSL